MLISAKKGSSGSGGGGGGSGRSNGGGSSISSGSNNRRVDELVYMVDKLTKEMPQQASKSFQSDLLLSKQRRKELPRC